MIFNFNASEVFRIAVEIEENGKNFYEKSQEHVGDMEVRKLFEELALQEVDHKKRFEALRGQLPATAASPTVWDPENELEQYIKMMADQHVFVSSQSMVEQLERIKDVKDALKLAIQFEKDSVLFFLSLQDATAGKEGQEVINLLVKEEQEHLRKLSLQLMRLSR